MDNVSIKSIPHPHKREPGALFWEITFTGDLATKHRSQIGLPESVQQALAGQDSHDSWDTIEEAKACIERVLGHSVTDREIAQACVWDDE